ncbi:SRPBCC family protein [Jeongeupia naejangsanensis]|uniref:SRPBCC family protein n=1 Tax=Jeongeupia naejangsanensis TaxID=613195 RepID=A0ABS2BJP0_9NEIS|nr:SRPBCC family protein [Jeongeupia naejangsanensis]MBM3115830.1 SRPBCC family protein [Jeongeupia naejangsanensis]
MSFAAEPDQPKIVLEQKFDVSAEKAWGKLGTFCSIAHWQSLVRDCLVEERSDGIYRVVVMKNDTAYTERLETFSQSDRSFSYSILSGPLPVNQYRSELKVESRGSESKLVWRAWYTVPEKGDSQKIKSDLESLFRNGINGMTALLHS